MTTKISSGSYSQDRSRYRHGELRILRCHIAKRTVRLDVPNLNSKALSKPLQGADLVDNLPFDFFEAVSSNLTTPEAEEIEEAGVRAD
jgi:hypothetical protein